MATPARQPTRPTTGDYFAITLAPVLIMVLVGSLTFFLAELLYHGDQGGRLRWTLAWFTMASVLTTRIALEFGSDRGLIYGFALAGVTSLALIRYVEPPFAGLLLIGVSWICVDRLVRDCTLIDEDQDATGEGLLDLAGFGPPSRSNPSERTPGRLLYPQHATPEPRGAAPIAGEAPSNTPARPPGIWVVGFSLAALPLFGVGQALLPSADLGRREIAFTCLWFYLLSGFGLLLTTSFLGLRRYLRQRRLTMPPSIALSWLTRGTVTAVTLLLLAFLLPRPEASYSLPALAERIGETSPQSASTARARNPKPVATEGRNGSPAPGGNRPDSDTRSATGNSDPGPTEAAGKESRESTSPSDFGRSSPPLESSTPTPPIPAKVPSALGKVLQWMIYAALAATCLWMVVRHGAEIWRALREIVCGLFSSGLLRKPAEFNGTGRSPTPSHRPFSAYRHPFLDPGLARLSPREVVTYSFEAVQAWAAGNGIPRQSEETPLEFAHRVGNARPEFAPPLLSLATCYGGVAYAGREPGPDSLPAVRQLWTLMRANDRTVG